MSLCFQTETQELRAGEGLHSGPPADRQQSQNLLSASPATAGPQHGSPTFPRPLSAAWAKEAWVGTASSQNRTQEAVPKEGLTDRTWEGPAGGNSWLQLPGQGWALLPRGRARPGTSISPAPRLPQSSSSCLLSLSRAPQAVTGPSRSL